MATIRKRNGKWQVQVRIKGSAAVSRTFLSKADAQVWSRAMESEADRHGLSSGIGKLEKLTVGDILRRYQDEITPRKKGATREKMAIRTLLTHSISDINLAKLSASHVITYINERLLTVKSATVCRELSLYQHAFRVARVVWELPLATNHFALVQKPKVSNSRTRRLEAGEWERLRDACARSRNPYILPMVELAVSTGMRRGEVLAIRWEHIDFEKRVLHIPITKNGYPRIIPLTPQAIAILKRQIKGTEAQPSCVFQTTEDAIKTAWRRVISRCCLIDFRYHDLRHEAISRFFELGLTMPEVALISGHRDTKMLMRYTHIRPENVSRKLAELAKITVIDPVDSKQPE